MAYLIFDKGTDRERIFETDSVFEHPMSNRLNASKAVAAVEGVVFPDLEEFKVNHDFETVALMDGEEIHLVGQYNHIEDVSVSYYSAEKTWSDTIVLGYVDR